MSLMPRETWSMIHGFVFGGLFLLSYTGGLVGFLGLREGSLTPEGAVRHARELSAWTTAMAIIAWGAVILGAYVIYPWYRAQPTPHESLAKFPQARLMANPANAGWHNFGMEWKEHVAWFAPMLATCVAYIVWRYRERLAQQNPLRRFCITAFSVAFLAATAAGVFGALLTKVAPV
ncbi:MAG: hypothetical protein ACYC96_14495 [Fimbriimonadaceae bacterium]